MSETRQQATGSRTLVGGGAADIGLQVISVGVDVDFVFRCDANDVRGVEGGQQRT